MYKTFGLQQRKAGLSHTDYVAHWMTVHAPMCAGVDDLFGYICNEVTARADLGGEAIALDAEIDGVAQMWFTQPDGLMGLAKQPRVQTWFEDGPNFVGERLGFVAEEDVRVPPTRSADGVDKIIVLVAGDPGDVTCATGCAVSRVVSKNASANMEAFDMGPVSHFVELWGDGALDAARAIAAPKLGFTIREYEILAPFAP